MQSDKLFQKQQDMFSPAVEKVQWENLAPNEQQQIIASLSQILLALSSDLVIHGGSQDAIENKN